MFDCDNDCEYNVGDLVTYADKVTFAMPSLKIGIVIEILDIEEFLHTDGHEEDREEYYKGFMKEWENYNRIRKLGDPSPFGGYPEERERLLERSFGVEISTVCLLRVMWNTGAQYVEHPDDLKPCTKEANENE